jgi:hypothetical protein
MLVWNPSRLEAFACALKMLVFIIHLIATTHVVVYGVASSYQKAARSIARTQLEA